MPEAHCEAPTAGSVILAGILLKLGTYGFIKFALGICPSACFFFSPLIFTLGCTGIFYASFTAIRQTDLKRIIAYTSVAHMNLVMIGIFCFNTEGIEGAIFQSLCHGFVSSALFLLIGVLYDRHKTRLLTYFSGLVSTMPLFSLFFLFFTMSNIALPPTGSFFAEFLILFSVLKASPLICFFSATGMIWGGAYSLWLLNRIIYGNVKTQFEFRSTDLDLKEFIMFIPLVLCTCLVGVCPNLILDIIGPSVQFLLTITKYN